MKVRLKRLDGTSVTLQLDKELAAEYKRMRQLARRWHKISPRYGVDTTAYGSDWGVTVGSSPFLDYLEEELCFDPPHADEWCVPAVEMFKVNTIRQRALGRGEIEHKLETMERIRKRGSRYEFMPRPWDRTRPLMLTTGYPGELESYVILQLEEGTEKKSWLHPSNICLGVELLRWAGAILPPRYAPHIRHRFWSDGILVVVDVVYGEKPLRQSILSPMKICGWNSEGWSFVRETES